MSKKKHIKAPLTYDPGKGRPKEHLAYLNYQEMQALKRLNGNNMETGPRGLPSFPPADAIGSSSLSKTTTKTTTSTSSPRGNTGSYPSRGTVTTTSKTTTTASKPSTSATGPGGMFGGGGGSSGGTSKTTTASSGSKQPTSTTSKIGSAASSQRSGPAYQAPSSSGGRTGFSGAGTNTRDAVARQVAASRDATKIARESPAFRGDAVKGGVRSINVGPMGTEVPIGGKVKGAISQVAEAAKKPTQPRDMQGPIPKGISPNEYGWGATGPSLLPSYQLNRVYGGDLAAQGRKFDQKQYDTLLNANTVTDPALNRQVNALSEEMRRNAAILSSAAKLANMDPRLGIGMGAAESSLGSDPRLNNGPYRGLMQMGQAAWGESANPTSRKLGRENPWASAQAGIAYADKNRALFVQGVGREPTLSDLYGMHQQGANGYITLRQNPNAPARDIVGMDAVRKNLPKSLQKSAGKMTAAEFADRISAYPQEKLAKLSGMPSSPSQDAAKRPTATAAVGIPTARPDTYVDPAVAAGRRPERYAAPTTVASDPRAGLPLGAFPAARPVTVMTDPRVGIPPAPNRPNVAANAASLAGKVTSLARGLFGNQTPAAASIGPDPFMVAKKPAEMGVVAPRGNPTGPFGAPVPDSKLPGKVALEPMETPTMPGAPKGTTTKTDVYTVKKGSIPADAEKTISDVLQNPDKITQLAKEQKWGNQDPKRLAEIKRDINTLKELGVKVENGKITIPKAAAQKAQTTLNKIATSYSPTFGKMAPGYGDTFGEGLGSISKKSTTTTTKPPSAEKMSRYDMNMADYRDAMRGLAMSPSLQKPGDVYAGAMRSPAQSMVAGDPRVNMAPGSLPASRAQTTVAGDPRASIPPYSNEARRALGLGVIGVAPEDTYRDPAAVAGRPAERGIADLPYRDPAAVAGQRPEAFIRSLTAPIGSAAAAEESVRRAFVLNQLAELETDPVIKRELKNAVGQALWDTRIADSVRAAQNLPSRGNFGEVGPAGPLSGFRTLDQQANIPGEYTGIKDPARGYHTWGMAMDLVPPRQPGESTTDYNNRVGEVNREIMRNMSDQNVKWGGEFSNVDPAHFQYGSGGVNKSVNKFGSNIQTAGVRPDDMPGTGTPGTQRLYVQESIAPWKAGTYDTPYPVDANGVPIQNVSPEDRAKQDARRRGVPYTPTPEEKKAIAAGTIVTRVIGSKIPGLSTVINTKAKMTDFYSRPSWEQAYIAQRAKDWAIARGDVKASPSEVAAAKQRIATHTVPNGTAAGSGGTKTASGSSGIGESRGSSSSNIYNQIASEINSGAISAPGSGGNSGGESPAALNSSRPYAYYEWDLGVNIPSPGDAKYNEFQGYLAERAAAQAAMYT